MFCSHCGIVVCHECLRQCSQCDAVICAACHELGRCDHKEDIRNRNWQRRLPNEKNQERAQRHISKYLQRLQKSNQKDTPKTYEEQTYEELRAQIIARAYTSTASEIQIGSASTRRSGFIEEDYDDIDYYDEEDEYDEEEEHENEEQITWGFLPEDS